MATVEDPTDRPVPPTAVPRRRFGLPSLGLRVSERKLLLGLADFALLSAALVLSLWLRASYVPPFDIVFASWKWFATLAVLWFAIATVFDAYDLARAASTTYSVLNAVAAALLTGTLYLAIPWLTPTVENRSQAFLFVLFAALGVGLWRALYAQLFVQPTFERRALAVGAGASGQALIHTLQTELAQRDANPFRGTGYLLVGFVDDSAGSQSRINGFPILGSSTQLVQLVRSLAIDEVVLTADPDLDLQPELFEALLDCREMGVPITKLSTVYERQSGRIALEYAGRDLETATMTSDNPFVRTYGLIKRVSDLLGAGLALILLGLLLPIIWLANRLLARGPLFFRQQRVGQGGRPFQILKFRTMIPDAEAVHGAVWASDRDPRVTPVGRWLRWSHLDELPQVINVLRGEMSLVGPRPERPEFAGDLARAIPFYRARHCLRPGITGWAQIHQDYGDSLESAREKLEYDLYYIKHSSPLLDILIMLRTVAKVFTLKGR